MDAAHKEKLAQGRKDAQAVKAYLEFLETNKPKRGRRRTEDSIAARLAAIDDELGESRQTRLGTFVIADQFTVGIGRKRGESLSRPDA